MAPEPLPAGRPGGAVLPLFVLALGSVALAVDDDDLGIWELELDVPAPVDPGFPERLEGVETLKCGFCHEEITEEWATTLHALAWVDPRYQTSLEGKRRPESCHGCHAPVPLHAEDALGARPAARTGERQKRHFGISCTTCHLGTDGVVLGPWGIETDAHESVAAETLLGAGSNELCITCHRTTVGPVIGIAQDFIAERLEERGMTCVGCHMAPVERPAATDDDDQPTAVRRGRSHLIQTPRDPSFLALSFELRAERTPDGARVVLANRAGHRVPGLLERRLVFRAELLDAGGDVVGSAEAEITGRSPLAVLGERTLELAGAGERVRLRAEHFAPEAETAVPFLERELELP